MKNRWVIPILVLPVMVIIVIPTGLLFVFRNSHWAHVLSRPGDLTFWFGAVFGVIGFLLAGWSCGMFSRLGDGTPAPWDPPARFVVRGPYCHVRNPMILGVILVLLGEALLLRSWPLFAWFAVFVAANALYIPLIEEKELARRFGNTYLQYKQQVSCWMPRITPWQPDV